MASCLQQPQSNAETVTIRSYPNGYIALRDRTEGFYNVWELHASQEPEWVASYRLDTAARTSSDVVLWVSKDLTIIWAFETLENRLLFPSPVETAPPSKIESVLGRTGKRDTRNVERDDIGGRREGEERRGALTRRQLINRFYLNPILRLFPYIFSSSERRSNSRAKTSNDKIFDREVGGRVRLTFSDVRNLPPSTIIKRKVPEINGICSVALKRTLIGFRTTSSKSGRKRENSDETVGTLNLLLDFPETYENVPLGNFRWLHGRGGGGGGSSDVARAVTISPFGNAEASLIYAFDNTRENLGVTHVFQAKAWQEDEFGVVRASEKSFYWVTIAEWTVENACIVSDETTPALSMSSRIRRKWGNERFVFSGKTLSRSAATERLKKTLLGPNALLTNSSWFAFLLGSMASEEADVQFPFWTNAWKTYLSNPNKQGRIEGLRERQDKYRSDDLTGFDRTLFEGYVRAPAPPGRSGVSDEFRWLHSFLEDFLIRDDDDAVGSAVSSFGSPSYFDRNGTVAKAFLEKLQDNVVKSMNSEDVGRGDFASAVNSAYHFLNGAYEGIDGNEQDEASRYGWDWNEPDDNGDPSVWDKTVLILDFLHELPYFLEETWPLYGEPLFDSLLKKYGRLGSYPEENVSDSDPSAADECRRRVFGIRTTSSSSSGETGASTYAGFDASSPLPSPTYPSSSSSSPFFYGSTDFSNYDWKISSSYASEGGEPCIVLSYDYDTNVPKYGKVKAVVEPPKTLSARHFLEKAGAWRDAVGDASVGYCDPANLIWCKKVSDAPGGLDASLDFVSRGDLIVGYDRPRGFGVDGTGGAEKGGTYRLWFVSDLVFELKTAGSSASTSSSSCFYPKRLVLEVEIVVEPPSPQIVVYAKSPAPVPNRTYREIALGTMETLVLAGKETEGSGTSRNRSVSTSFDLARKPNDVPEEERKEGAPSPIVVQRFPSKIPRTSSENAAGLSGTYVVKLDTGALVARKTLESKGHAELRKEAENSAKIAWFEYVSLENPFYELKGPHTDTIVGGIADAIKAHVKRFKDYVRVDEKDLGYYAGMWIDAPGNALFEEAKMFISTSGDSVRALRFYALALLAKTAFEDRAYDGAAATGGIFGATRFSGFDPLSGRLLRASVGMRSLERQMKASPPKNDGGAPLEFYNLRSDEAYAADFLDVLLYNKSPALHASWVSTRFFGESETSSGDVAMDFMLLHKEEIESLLIDRLKRNLFSPSWRGFVIWIAFGGRWGPIDDHPIPEQMLEETRRVLPMRKLPSFGNRSSSITGADVVITDEDVKKRLATYLTKRDDENVEQRELSRYVGRAVNSAMVLYKSAKEKLIETTYPIPADDIDHLSGLELLEGTRDYGNDIFDALGRIAETRSSSEIFGTDPDPARDGDPDLFDRRSALGNATYYPVLLRDAIAEKGFLVNSEVALNASYVLSMNFALNVLLAVYREASMEEETVRYDLGKRTSDELKRSIEDFIVFETGDLMTSIKRLSTENIAYKRAMPLTFASIMNGLSEARKKILAYLDTLNTKQSNDELYDIGTSLENAKKMNGEAYAEGAEKFTQNANYKASKWLKKVKGRYDELDADTQKAVNGQLALMRENADGSIGNLSKAIIAYDTLDEAARYLEDPLSFHNIFVQNDDDGDTADASNFMPTIVRVMRAYDAVQPGSSDIVKGYNTSLNKRLNAWINAWRYAFIIDYVDYILDPNSPSAGSKSASADATTDEGTDVLGGGGGSSSESGAAENEEEPGVDDLAIDLTNVLGGPTESPVLPAVKIEPGTEKAPEKSSASTSSSENEEPLAVTPSTTAEPPALPAVNVEPKSVDPPSTPSSSSGNEVPPANDSPKAGEGSSESESTDEGSPDGSPAKSKKSRIERPSDNPAATPYSSNDGKAPVAGAYGILESEKDKMKYAYDKLTAETKGRRSGTFEAYFESLKWGVQTRGHQTEILFGFYLDYLVDYAIPRIAELFEHDKDNGDDLYLDPNEEDFNSDVKPYRDAMTAIFASITSELFDVFRPVISFQHNFVFAWKFYWNAVRSLEENSDPSRRERLYEDIFVKAKPGVQGYLCYAFLIDRGLAFDHTVFRNDDGTSVVPYYGVIEKARVARHYADESEEQFERQKSAELSLTPVPVSDVRGDLGRLTITDRNTLSSSLEGEEKTKYDDYVRKSLLSSILNSGERGKYVMNDSLDVLEELTDKMISFRIYGTTSIISKVASPFEWFYAIFEYEWNLMRYLDAFTRVMIDIEQPPEAALSSLDLLSPMADPLHGKTYDGMSLRLTSLDVEKTAVPEFLLESSDNGKVVSAILRGEFPNYVRYIEQVYGKDGNDAAKRNLMINFNRAFARTRVTYSKTLTNKGDANAFLKASELAASYKATSDIPSAAGDGVRAFQSADEFECYYALTLTSGAMKSYALLLSKEPQGGPAPALLLAHSSITQKIFESTFGAFSAVVKPRAAVRVDKGSNEKIRGRVPVELKAQLSLYPSEEFEYTVQYNKNIVEDANSATYVWDLRIATEKHDSVPKIEQKEFAGGSPRSPGAREKTSRSMLKSKPDLVANLEESGAQLRRATRTESTSKPENTGASSRSTATTVDNRGNVGGGGPNAPKKTEPALSTKEQRQVYRDRAKSMADRVRKEVAERAERAKKAADANKSNPTNASGKLNVQWAIPSGHIGPRYDASSDAGRGRAGREMRKFRAARRRDVYDDAKRGPSNGRFEYRSSTSKASFRGGEGPSFRSYDDLERKTHGGEFLDELDFWTTLQALKELNPDWISTFDFSPARWKAVRWRVEERHVDASTGIEYDPESNAMGSVVRKAKLLPLFSRSASSSSSSGNRRTLAVEASAKDYAKLRTIARLEDAGGSLPLLYVLLKLKKDVDRGLDDPNDAGEERAIVRSRRRPRALSPSLRSALDATVDGLARYKARVEEEDASYASSSIFYDLLGSRSRAGATTDRDSGNKLARLYSAFDDRTESVSFWNDYGTKRVRSPPLTFVQFCESFCGPQNEEFRNRRLDDSDNRDTLDFSDALGRLLDENPLHRLIYACWMYVPEAADKDEKVRTRREAPEHNPGPLEPSPEEMLSFDYEMATKGVNVHTSDGRTFSIVFENRMSPRPWFLSLLSDEFRSKHPGSELQYFPPDGSGSTDFGFSVVDSGREEFSWKNALGKRVLELTVEEVPRVPSIRDFVHEEFTKSRSRFDSDAAESEEFEKTVYGSREEEKENQSNVSAVRVGKRRRTSGSAKRPAELNFTKNLEETVFRYFAASPTGSGEGEEELKILTEAWKASGGLEDADVFVRVP